MELEVLSLFDGMSCGQIACHKAKLKVNNYYASEISGPAIKVTQDNFKNTVHLGSVEGIHYLGNHFQLIGKSKVTVQCKEINLLLGGSPCQDLRPGRDGLSGSKSKLFYEFVRIKKSLKEDVKFLFENTGKISEADKKIISELLGVEPIKINSGLVSPQNRIRNYWTNIPFNGIEDREIYLVDVLEKNPDPKYTISDKALEGFNRRLNRNKEKGNGYSHNIFKPEKVKIKTLVARYYKDGKECLIHQEGKNPRKLTPVEFERMQNVPDNYTACVPERYRYEMIGNGWTVDIITEILMGLNATV